VEFSCVSPNIPEIGKIARACAYQSGKPTNQPKKK
jgi:hypothetical protein